MNKEVSTKDVSNLVDTLVSSKLMVEQNRDDMFRIICSFLEWRLGVTLKKTFKGRAYLEFDFSAMDTGNADDVAEQVSQDILESLYSSKYFNSNSLTQQNIYFKDITSDYNSREGNQ